MEMCSWGLLTNEMRWRRGLDPSNLCPLCGDQEESLLHGLHDCIHCRQTWRILAHNAMPGEFFQVAIQQWFSNNLDDQSQRNGVAWSTLFGVALMTLWQDRNEYVFKGKPIDFRSIAYRIRREAETIQLSSVMAQ